MYPTRSGRLSFFAAASWLGPVFVFLMMVPYVDAARERERGSFLPGWGAAFTQLGIAAGLAFILGLLSIIRSERLRWIAIIPCFFGGLFSLWFGGAVLHDRGLFRAIQNSLVLSVGILMALIGVSCFACYSAAVSARLAQGRQEGGTEEHDARTNMNAMKLIGIATLVVGIGFILLHVFELF